MANLKTPAIGTINTKDVNLNALLQSIKERIEKLSSKVEDLDSKLTTLITKVNNAN